MSPTQLAGQHHRNPRGGSRILEYPRILEAPTGEVLALYREHQTGVMTWFLVLVVVALSRTVLPRWLAVGGYLAAGLIVTGVIVPVVEAASLTNFAGYVVWCAWLLTVVIVLWRTSAYASDTELARHGG